MQAESIDYIRFTTISPDVIKRMSVAKLIVPDTYNEEGYPIDGGLVDQRLGVIDPGLKCKTCGGRAKTCPGHFGHLELIRPVIHPEFAKTIFLIMQSTCFQCHRLLLTDAQVKEASEVIRSAVKSEEEAVPDLHEALGATPSEPEQAKSTAKGRAVLMKKLKSTKRCPYCEAIQPKLKLERPTFFYIDNNKMKPDEIQDWLSKVTDGDLELIGIDPRATRPEWFVVSTLLVPPVNVRPSITLESGERSEDDLTHKLVDIMRINQRLEQDIEAGAPQIIIDDLWELLQYQVTTYFNNETPGVPVARHKNTRPLKTLAQRLKGKEGRLRYNLSGKRVNFSARAVISPDASLTVNQVGVPMKLAENLTLPLYVTAWNIEEARKFLESKAYPQVLNVILPGGMRKKVLEANREELLKDLKPGQILERQLMDGDLVLFNRQPTLHRLSMMAHEVKVLPGRTLKLHVSIAFPYNADFDGDEMNVHVPQSIEAQTEARYLMQPKDQFLSPKNGMPTIFTEEDEVIGAFLISRDEARYTKEEACRMLAAIGIYDLPKPLKDGTYAGKSIISMILPKDFDFDAKLGDTRLVIKGGQIQEGVVNEKAIGGDGGALISKVFQEYGPDAANKFILDLTRLVLMATEKYGMTLSLRDYYNTEAMDKKSDEIANEAIAKANQILESYRNKKLEPLPGYTRKQTFEALSMAELGAARHAAEKAIRDNTGMDNNGFLIAKVRARGSILNMVQSTMLVGQQSVRGARVSRGYAGRVLPYFKRNDKSPEAKGFVRSSFIEGLKPTEFYMHAMGSRDSSMVKSLVTAVSGYLQRRLINAMQDFYVDGQLGVRDASGSLIQTVYGGSGIDPMYTIVAKQKAQKK